MWPHLDSQPQFSDATVHGASRPTPTTGLPSSGFGIFRPRALDCPSSYSVLPQSVPKNDQPRVHSLSQQPPLPRHLGHLPSSDVLQAEIVSTGVWPAQVHVTRGSEGSRGWFNALVSPSLILNTVIFILWFCQWVWKDSGAWAQKMRAICTRTISSCPVHRWHSPCPTSEMLQWTRSGRSPAGQACRICDRVSGGVDSPRRPPPRSILSSERRQWWPEKL